MHTIRGMQVMLDRDLAEFYNVETRVLKQAIKRNIERFPKDFMFFLTKKEIDFMVSQNVIPSKQHLGGHLPIVFTERGVANISSILKSKRAIEINIFIMRAFVQMRSFIQKNKNIFKRLNIVETKLLEHDNNFDKIFDLMQNNIPKQGIFFDGQVFDVLF
ncbi:MAG: ORF6N domain-containing protein [Nanoarchaeota archaeon]